MLGRLRRLARFRMCEGAVIPPETRVDPSRFSEDEFPVSCPQCEYELRGLSGECCPECGRPFDRGRLLVEQYLLCRDLPLSAIGKFARTVAVAGWFVLIAAGICFGLVLTRIDPNRIDPQHFLFPIMLAFIAAGVLTFLGSVIWGRQQERNRASRKERACSVFEAIDRSEPSFVRAQKLIFVPAVLSTILAVCFLVLAEDADDYLGGAIFLITACVLCLQAIRGMRPNRNRAR